jgi:hypothetical protein
VVKVGRVAVAAVLSGGAFLAGVAHAVADPGFGAPVPVGPGEGAELLQFVHGAPGEVLIGGMDPDSTGEGPPWVAVLKPGATTPARQVLDEQADAMSVSLAANPVGQAVVAWSRGFQSPGLGLAVRDDPSAAFERPPRGPPGYVMEAHVAIDHSGDAFVEYVRIDTSSATGQIWGLFRTAGDAPGPPVPIGPSFDQDRGIPTVAVALEDSGRATVAWSFNAGDPDKQASVYTAVGTPVAGFSPALDLGGSVAWLAPLHLGLDARGGALLAWEEGPNGEPLAPRFEAASYRPPGGEFTPAARFARASWQLNTVRVRATMRRDSAPKFP